jgi:Flp pilus assembly protein TadD
LRAGSLVVLVLDHLDRSGRITAYPTNAVAYWGRGVAYKRTNEKAKADEDFAHAKKLGYKGK